MKSWTHISIIQMEETAKKSAKVLSEILDIEVMSGDPVAAVGFAVGVLMERVRLDPELAKLLKISSSNKESKS